MLEFLREGPADTVAAKASGTITEEEVDAAIEQFDRTMTDRVIKRMFYDWVELVAWGKGARTVGTWFGMHHWATIRKIAILADGKWDDECLRVADINKLAEVRRFPPSERNEAWVWLTQ